MSLPLNDATDKKSPLLSIITVCLNAPKVERTCESIVNQTFQNFEWIVIDGGSDDNTLAIFEKYKNRMDYFVSEPDGGIYFGMNKGMEKATGEWLNFMNAGDMFIVKNVLETVFDSGANLHHVDVLYGRQYYEERGIYTPPESIDKAYLYYHTLFHQSTFIRRSKCGPYDTSYRYAADWKFFISLYNDGAVFKQLGKVISVFDNNGISIHHNKSPQRLGELARIQKECFSKEEQSTLGKMRAAYAGKNRRLIPTDRQRLKHALPKSL